MTHKKIETLSVDVSRTFLLNKSHTSRVVSKLEVMIFWHHIRFGHKHRQSLEILWSQVTFLFNPWNQLNDKNTDDQEFLWWSLLIKSCKFVLFCKRDKTNRFPARVARIKSNPSTKTLRVPEKMSLSIPPPPPDTSLGLHRPFLFLFLHPALNRNSSWEHLSYLFLLSSLAPSNLTPCKWEECTVFPLVTLFH